MVKKRRLAQPSSTETAGRTLVELLLSDTDRHGTFDTLSNATASQSDTGVTLSSLTGMKLGLRAVMECALPLIWPPLCCL